MKRTFRSYIALALVLVILLAPWAGTSAAPSPLPGPQVHLPGSAISQFVDSLPLLSVAGGSMETVVAGPGEITLNMLEFQANLMPSTFAPASGGPYTGTWVFGYRVGPTTAPASAVETNVGPVIVATRGVPTQIRYVNNLTANNIHWRDWIDQSVHWANPLIPPELMMIPNPNPPPDMIGNPNKYLGPVPAVPHLHGGEVPGVVDGGPEAWFLSNEPTPGTYTPHGAAYYTEPGAAANEAIYTYPNSQEAAPLWFHDHLLGATRINATFAGLAGAYPIIDPGLALPTGLHPVGLQNADGSNLRFTVPLVIQDRMFDTEGQLFFPTDGINPEHPRWVPEFVGDTIIVNGKVWPYLNVDQQRYHFYAINGSNSVPYSMWLETDSTTPVVGPPLWVIATDGGYLNRPVKIDPALGERLLMMPGERYEIVIDFSGVAPGTNLILRNDGETVDGPPDPATTGRIMQFRVSANAPVDTSYNPASGNPLRPPMVRLADPVAGTLGAGVTPALTRELTLNEVAFDDPRTVNGVDYPGGPLEVLVNNTKWTGLRAGDGPIPGSTLNKGLWLTELPREGDTEVWEVVNLTMDRHPIHLHGVQFQILNRQEIDQAAFETAYAASFPGGVFAGGYGPPLGYDPSIASGGKYGGNPDVTPYLIGAAAPPGAYEAGWKDTAIMPPGFVSRIAVRFAPQDKAIGDPAMYFSFDPSAYNGYYVWHCHITDHEDNEMMRPYQFQPAAGAVRTFPVAPPARPSDLNVGEIKTSPKVVRPGDSVTVSFRVKNQSDNPTGPFSLGISLVPPGGPPAEVNAKVPMGALAHWSSSAGSGTLILPDTAPLGKYKVVVTADNLNQVTETNENNNVGVYQYLNVTLPNLGIDSLNASPRTVKAGTTVLVTFTVKNQSDIGAAPSTARVSIVPLPGPAAPVVTMDVPVGGILPWGSVPVTDSLAVPAVTIPGKYQVVVTVDALHQVAETNEADNTKAWPYLVVTPP